MAATSTREARIRRHHRVRRKIKGTAQRPRLSVYRSLNHIYAQVINDTQGQTLVAASTVDPELKSDSADKSKSGKAGLVGTMLAKRALEKGIKDVVFDRGGCKYHGRVKALAEAARQGGLKF